MGRAKRDFDFEAPGLMPSLNLVMKVTSTHGKWYMQCMKLIWAHYWAPEPAMLGAGPGILDCFTVFIYTWGGRFSIHKREWIGVLRSWLDIASPDAR